MWMKLSEKITPRNTAILSVLLLILSLAIFQNSDSNSSPKNSTEPTGYAYGPAGRIAYRYVDGKLERLSKNQIWSAQDNRKDSEFDPIRVAAYNSINSIQKDLGHSNIYFEEIIRDGFPADISQSIKLQSVDAASYLSPLLDKKIQIKLILVTEKDQDFVNKELPAIVPKYDWQGALDSIANYKTKEDFYSSSGTGGGTASFLVNENFGYYIGHTSSLATMETYWPEVAPHEMAHVLQGYLAKGFNSNYPDGHPQAKWARHLIEGSANTLGMAIGFKTLGWYSDEMDLLLERSIEWINRGGSTEFKNKFPMQTDQDAYNLIVALEAAKSQELSDLSYSAGQFLWEFYIGKFGADKYLELLRNASKTQTLSENFKSTIGISKEDFYKMAAPYLLANWKRLS